MNWNNIAAERDRLDWLENQNRIEAAREGRCVRDGKPGGEGEQPGLFRQLIGALLTGIFTVSMIELLKCWGVL